MPYRFELTLTPVISPEDSNYHAPINQTNTKMKKEGKYYGKHKTKQKHSLRAEKSPVSRYLEATEKLPGYCLEP